MLFKKKKPRFDDVAGEINRFKLHVTAIPCPACTQNTLKVERLEVGPKAWTADINCRNCGFKGSASTSGFSFIGVSSQGQAVKQVKKEKT